VRQPVNSPTSLTRHVAAAPGAGFADQMGLFTLDNFIPDEEVPNDPDENKRNGSMLRFGYDIFHRDV